MYCYNWRYLFFFFNFCPGLFLSVRALIKTLPQILQFKWLCLRTKGEGGIEMAAGGGEKPAHLNKNLNLLECLGNWDSAELGFLWVNFLFQLLSKWLKIFKSLDFLHQSNMIASFA